MALMDPTPSAGELGRWPGSGERPHWPDRLLERLLERRIVLVSGPLGDELATRVCAQILALGARAEEPILIYLSSPDGELGAAMTVMDTLDAVRTPVDAIVTGHLGGPSLGVLAATDRRRAYQHATFRLSEPRTQFRGIADQVTADASRSRALLESLYERLSRTTGRPVETVRSDAQAGRFLSAAEAIDYGLVEGIVDRLSH
jgi:ATP-dependent Clp protease, protease subunit